VAPVGLEGRLLAVLVVSWRLFWWRGIGGGSFGGEAGECALVRRAAG